MDERSPLLLKYIRSRKPSGLGVRHFQAVLLLGALMFGYFLRVNMSVAVMAMTNPAKLADVPHFNWDKDQRSLILSSFFWGYVVAQVPAGMLSQKIGAKIVLAVSTAICSIMTVIIPFAADLGYEYVCASRVIVGFTQGVVYPCVHALLAKWAPRTERAFLSTAIYSGAQLGTVIMLATSGVMSDSIMGWPSIFYISGAITFAWSMIYFVFGANSPSEVKTISKVEQEYIQCLTGGSEVTKDMPIPWKGLFTSTPFYALIFAHCGFTWGFYTLLTEIPTYMDKVLKKDINQNALLSALPYLTMWLLSLIISPLADFLNNKGITSVVLSRKLFNSIGQWVPMVSLIALGYMTVNESTLAVFLLTIGVGFNSASLVGYMVNHMDLAPNFAGTMMGITNGLSNLLSIFAPIVVSAVIDNEEDPAEWRIVFFITAGVYLVCNLIFVLFGSATVQPWNECKSSLPKVSQSQQNNNTSSF